MTSPMNILWIITDDAMRATLGKMPKVWSRLVQQGTRFGKFYTAVPWCGPARSSIFTGMYAHNHGVFTNQTFGSFNARNLADDTVATRLQAAGYTTGLFGKYLNAYNDTDYVAPGWNRWVAMTHGGDSKVFAVDGAAKNAPTSQTVDEYAAEKCRGFIDYHKDDAEPWFAVFTPSNPHDPYTPSAAHAHDFDNADWDPASFNEVSMGDKPTWMRGGPMQDRDQMTKAWRGKLEELGDTDDQIGQILDLLGSTGQMGSTAIFFLSDNGYLLGEHRQFKKEQPYEESAGVPFVVRGPGWGVNQFESVLVSQVDLMPTALEIAGLDPDAGRELDGRSMLSQLNSDDWTLWRHRLLCENPHSNWAMLAEGDQRLIDHYVAGEQELYDLGDDPDQMDSIHASTDTTAMTERLTALRQASGLALRVLEV